MSKSWLYNLLKQRRETGTITPKVRPTRYKTKLTPHEQEVRNTIAEHADATLSERCEMLEKHVAVSRSTLYRFLLRLKITFKKTLHAAEQQREDVAEKRSRWSHFQSGMDYRRFVFIDETWAKTNMTPLYGWAPMGKRVIDYVPHGHWKTTTFIAALRHDRLTAPMVIDGAINGGLFLAYVNQILVSTLQEGDIVVLDNLSSHKVSGVKQAIESVGAQVLYLPP